MRYPAALARAYVFDLDGTVYLGDSLLPGAGRAIAGLRRAGAEIRYLSNNPTKTPAAYAAKLAGLGLPTPPQDIVNTVVTTVRWLTLHCPQAVLFPIAEAPLVTALREAGFRLSEDPAEIDVVIASYDRGFDYRKLQIAFDAIWQQRRAFLVQTNPDAYCPFPGGRGEPDCAAVTAAIEACTGQRCRHSFGKPDPLMLETLELAAPRSETVMVGDRLRTDIAMGKAAGMATALVLTGETTAAEVRCLPSDQRPDYVLDRLDRLIPAPLA
ncbi:MAG: HAD-IIA family hydrolase [Propionibacteriaceae bacterium]|nr:HAD-IIA family hydrolase [Propionibacteriaceae bacterium]